MICIKIIDNKYNLRIELSYVYNDVYYLNIDDLIILDDNYILQYIIRDNIKIKKLGEKSIRFINDMADYYGEIYKYSELIIRMYAVDISTKYNRALKLNELLEN